MGIKKRGAHNISTSNLFLFLFIQNLYSVLFTNKRYILFHNRCR